MASVYRRGRQWWGRVQRQGRELRQPLKTTDKSVAKERLREWLDRLDAIAWGEKPRRTFDDAMLKFDDEHLPTLRPRAAQRYRTSIVHLTDSFEGLFLDQITSAKLAEFEAKRRADGVSAPTIRRDLACLSSMFGCCIDWEWLDVNPVGAYLRRRKKRGALREAPPRRRYLTHAEEAAILKEAHPTVAKAIAFAIDTGLRKEEMFSLRRSQIRDGRVIVRAENTKGGRHGREVPLLPRAATISAQLPAHLQSDFLFVNPRRRVPGERRRKADRFNHLDRSLKAACRRAKVEDVRWHDLRRTCGCRLLQDHRMPIEQVSKWLGHASIAQTQAAYAFLEVEQLERTLEERRQAEAAAAKAKKAPARKRAHGASEK